MKSFKSLKIAVAFLLSLLIVTESFSAFAGEGKKVDPNYKPVVGISASENGPCGAPLNYVNAVRRAGGIPVVIPMTTDAEQIAAVLDIVDVIIMTGGEDIDPLSGYNEEPVPALGEVVPFRDKFDIMLIKATVEKGIPLLGICRGEQLLNVAMGGSLYQDIPSQVEGTYVKHRQSAPSSFGTHTVNLVGGSLLANILGVEQCVTNSHHHQAVKAVAPGYEIIAQAKDGVVEAIAKKGCNKILGVQFHPEGLINSADNSNFLKIFQYFMERGREYHASK